ncbi:MAG: XTP/dITP diphosphatase [Bacillales bacterium]|jgi:XTP/dITP diphosphohydrolase|nr:XTP/dITP diphosphatase [Bacillales bacterium]
MEILIATKNIGKIKEFKGMFESIGHNVKSLIDFPDITEIEETGTTFEENAIIKARKLSRLTGKIVISDDSGLEVDALNGEPGVYSARYAGNNKNDEDNINLVLEKLKGVPTEKRTARFICVIAVVFPTGSTETFKGICEGIITEEKKGNEGFGYDPIMYIPKLNRTMAELTKDEKNQISHRGNALRKMLDKMIIFR